MNIRKNIDYSEMYETLDNLMRKKLTQMERFRISYNGQNDIDKRV